MKVGPNFWAAPSGYSAKVSWVGWFGWIDWSGCLFDSPLCRSVGMFPFTQPAARQLPRLVGSLEALQGRQFRQFLFLFLKWVQQETEKLNKRKGMELIISIAYQ